MLWMLFSYPFLNTVPDLSIPCLLPLLPTQSIHDRNYTYNACVMPIHVSLTASDSGEINR